MITKNDYNEFYVVCDVCGKETAYKFATHQECQHFIKQCWKSKFNKEERNYIHFCDECKELEE